MILWVIWISARLGWVLPEGWLCTRISGRADGERLGDDLARVDRAFVQRPVAHDLVEQQSVLGVEIEHAHPFVVEVRHIDGEIVDQRLPARQHRHFLHLRTGQAPRGDPGNAQRGGGGFLDAGHRLQRARIGVEHAGQRAEALQQHACQRLHVHARDHGHQQRLDHLVIGQRVVAAVSRRRRSRARWPDGSCAASRTRSNRVYRLGGPFRQIGVRPA
jgi:hypothetical protein